MATSHEESTPLSIQELIKKPLTSLPQRYIRLDDNDNNPNNNHLPNSSSPFLNQIPTINLKNLIHEGGDATSTQQLELEKFSSACKDWGFFQLVDHGISPQLLGKLKEEIEEFFKLPLEEKMKYKVRAGDVEGYGTVIISDDQKLDWGDRLYMITNPLHRRKPHLFPQLPSSLRSMLESYIGECQKVAMTLVRLVAKALKMEKREMEEVFEDGMQAVRMSYYPPCPQPDLVMGLTAHSDATGITILNQVNGVDGLQIKKDGVWVPVSVSQDALVVNVGDILEIMSNGAYKSVEHRATVNSEKERISMAMFFLPKSESEIGPSISLTNPQNPPLFKRVGTEKYVNDYITREKDGKSYLDLMKITHE